MKVQLNPTPTKLSLGRSANTVQPEKSFQAYLQDALEEVNTLQQE